MHVHANVKYFTFQTILLYSDESVYTMTLLMISPHPQDQSLPEIY